MLVTQRDKAIIFGTYVHDGLKREQIRQLFFKREDATVVGVKNVNERLDALTTDGYLVRKRDTAETGTGQYRYWPGTVGLEIITREYGFVAKIAPTVPIGHNTDLADWRIVATNAIQSKQGSVISWYTDKHAGYKFVSHNRSRKIAPDNYCFWEIHNFEGAFFTELEHGESHAMAAIASKLDGYDVYYQGRHYLEHLGAIALTPRLSFIWPDQRKARHFQGWVLNWQQKGRWKYLPTVYVGSRTTVFERPLERTWLTTGKNEWGNLFEFQ